MIIYYLETEGWVTEQAIMFEFISSTKQLKEYALFKKAIVERTEQVN